MGIESPPLIDIKGAETWLSYVGLAFAGSFLRAAKWRDDKGKVVWSRVFIELPVAFATASVAGSLGVYMNWQPPIIYGICGLLGLMGPAFFTGLGEALLSVIKSRFGKAGEKGE